MTSAVAAPDAAEQGDGEPRAGRQQPGLGREDGAGQVEHLRPDRLEVRPAQGDDGDELTLGRGLDVGDDVLGGDAGRGRQRGGQRGQVGDLGRVDPDVDDLGRGEQRSPRAVGDRGPLGQRPATRPGAAPRPARDGSGSARRRPASRPRPPGAAGSRRRPSPARRRDPRSAVQPTVAVSSSIVGRPESVESVASGRSSAVCWSSVVASSGSVVAAAAASRSPAAQSARNASAAASTSSSALPEHPATRGRAIRSEVRRAGPRLVRTTPDCQTKDPSPSRLAALAASLGTGPFHDRPVRTARWRTDRRRGSRPGGRPPGPGR